jgi:hypothetical protein
VRDSIVSNGASVSGDARDGLAGVVLGCGFMRKILNERRGELLAGFWIFFREAKTENTSPKARVLKLRVLAAFRTRTQ